METIERRKIDRRGAEAREERAYVVARRRIVAQQKIAQYRQGIDVARSLLGVQPPAE